MDVTRRTDQEANEHGRLCARASFSDESSGRERPTEKDYLRNDYQRDRDRILYSKAFRRLSHKTQVFLSPEGDHFRTRLTHTLEVTQIARTIARALGLNEDLTEAIALGHDLGHTPFGHAGEDVLRKCIATVLGIDPESCEATDLFHHNEQSVRIVEVIENSGEGMNLTREVRDGIGHHTGPVMPQTFEGQIVRIADRIAYVNHDIDDAIRAGILTEDQLPESTKRLLGTDHSMRISTLVRNLVETSAQTDTIRMEDEIWDAMNELRSFLMDNVYRYPSVLDEVHRASFLLEFLFWHYYENPDEIPSEYIGIAQGDSLVAVTDYIAGMTDRFAIRTFKNLFIPNSL
ncbi:MAG: deoxyguanosinetriphosphate triphosphohydrolase [Eggerthellaceae bacterium]|nr:deoxyguanosinetriphosphate triphosphohydrolase [Eggerthellaceae bacterium]